MENYLDIRELELKLGSFALGPVSLQLKKSDYLTLLGPTGCGKTTLIKCITGAYGRLRNRIFLEGRDIGNLPPEKRRVGYVAQISDLFPKLTVEKNVAFGLSYLRLSPHEKISRLEKYLDLFDIQKLRHRTADSLSGGETKKTALARSLAVEPNLLLLDEPLSMLDHNERKEMIDVLGMIHRELRTTTIHVTHDRHEAWSIAQACAVMNEGKILETGTVAQLFRSPAKRFVAEFLGGVNIFRADSAPWPMPGVEHEYVLLRPERISLAAENEKHKVSGKVDAARDFGEFIELVVSVGERGSLAVHAAVEKTAGIRPGDTVYLDWAEDAIHTFADGGRS